jgi:hypothetical protein
MEFRSQVSKQFRMGHFGRHRLCLIRFSTYVIRQFLRVPLTWSHLETIENVVPAFDASP